LGRYVPAVRLRGQERENDLFSVLVIKLFFMIKMAKLQAIILHPTAFIL